MVSYNHWVVSHAYRRSLLRQLGLPNREPTRRTVPGCAGGSSFDALAFDGRADEMPVLGRWRWFAGAERYWRLFPPQMLDLASHIFGPLAPAPPRGGVAQDAARAAAA